MVTDALSRATLAIYVTLSIPVLFCIARHGKTGLIGWLYLLAFCTLRIVGGAMSLDSSNSNTSSTSIIANIALSPLLLAASCIIHEGRAYRIARDEKVEWILVLPSHAIVVTPAWRSSPPVPPTRRKPTPPIRDLVLVDVGIAVLLAAWVYALRLDRSIDPDLQPKAAAAEGEEEEQHRRCHLCSWIRCYKGEKNRIVIDY